MINFKILIAASLMTSMSAKADVCSEVSCPKGREPGAICFIDPETSTGLWRRVSNAAACGYFTEIIIAPDTAKIKEALRNLTRSCKSLNRITFKGHADDGYQLAGSLDSGSIQDLQDFGCLLNPNATLHFSGCNIGKGCAGDMLFYQAAKALLPKGGIVYGPTFNSSTILPGVIPHFSRNGKYRQLNFKPQNRPPDSWTQTGLAITNGGSINDRCSNEIKSLISDLDEAKARALKKRCSSSNNIVSSQQLASYREIEARLSKSPPYLQTASSEVWYDISQALTRLKYQVQRYETCEPPTDTTTGTGQRENGVR